jgi:hypothetical protein
MFVGRTDSGKMMALRQLLSGGGGLAADGSQVPGLLPPILVFVSTKDRAKVGGCSWEGKGCHSVVQMALFLGFWGVQTSPGVHACLE